MPGTDISAFRFAVGDRLFFDTNIWFYLFPVVGMSQSQASAIYTRSFKNILQAKSTIYIDQIVLSEYINRFAKIKYDIFKGTTGQEISFKDFRNSSGFDPIAETISLFSGRILRLCTRIDCPFVKIDIHRIMSEFSSEKKDFNDQIISEVCKADNLKLVTNDGDFDKYTLDILTCNPELLRS